MRLSEAGGLGLLAELQGRGGVVGGEHDAAGGGGPVVTQGAPQTGKEPAGTPLTSGNLYARFCLKKKKKTKYQKNRLT
jgi:hypothetical protein